MLLKSPGIHNPVYRVLWEGKDIAAALGGTFFLYRNLIARNLNVLYHVPRAPEVWCQVVR